MPRWISVHDESPGEDINVLAYIDGIGVRVCYLYDGRWTYVVTEKWGIDVMYWMELPEAPNA